MFDSIVPPGKIHEMIICPYVRLAGQRNVLPIIVQSLNQVTGSVAAKIGRCLREDLELAARVGDKVYHCRALNTMGWVYMDLCHWDLALHYNAQSSTVSRAVGDPEIIRNAELNLGDCYLALGRREAGLLFLLG